MASLGCILRSAAPPGQREAARARLVHVEQGGEARGPLGGGLRSLGARLLVHVMHMRLEHAVQLGGGTKEDVALRGEDVVPHPQDAQLGLLRGGSNGGGAVLIARDRGGRDALQPGLRR